MRFEFYVRFFSFSFCSPENNNNYRFSNLRFFHWKYRILVTKSPFFTHSLTLSFYILFALVLCVHPYNVEWKIHRRCCWSWRWAACCECGEWVKHLLLAIKFKWFHTKETAAKYTHKRRINKWRKKSNTKRKNWGEISVKLQTITRTHKTPEKEKIEMFQRRRQNMHKHSFGLDMNTKWSCYLWNVLKMVYLRNMNQ